MNLRLQEGQQHGGRGTRDGQKPQNTSRQQHRGRSTIRQEGGLKVYYTNCRSLRNKIDLLRGKACVENFDIIAVTEAWIDINSKNFLSEFKIEGYKLFHEDRKGRKEGGGVIYVKDTLRFTVNNRGRADVTQRVSVGRYF